jgi:hypothetical protein
MDSVPGNGRTQGTLFPIFLEELISDDHICRVINAFADEQDCRAWDLSALRPPRPGDLTELYLYGYL